MAPSSAAATGDRRETVTSYNDDGVFNPSSTSSPSSTAGRHSEAAAHLVRVLGVALIVDQRFTGARLVARYPTRPPPPPPSSSGGSRRRRRSAAAAAAAGVGRRQEGNVDNTVLLGEHQHRPQNDHSGDNDEYRYDAQKDELFFSLTPHQMAKLFRTKKSLCGQPMTLRVNRTVFCCHAVLLDADDDDDNDHGDDASKDDGGNDDHDEQATRKSTDDGDERSENASTTTGTVNKEDNKLCLFSVVVALSAPDRHGAVPFSSFWDAGTEDQLDLERFLQEMSAATNHKGQAVAATKKATAARVSSAFLAIRRVHISLARYCRALEREENRCHYVSLQADVFFQIRTERQAAIPPSNGCLAVPSAASATSQQTNNDRKGRRRHSRHQSYGSTVLPPGTLEDGLKMFLKINPEADMSIEEEQEEEQEILELMMAAPPPKLPPERSTGLMALRYQHHGNLVRELIDVFHALSRNDGISRPTPTSLLTGNDSVVYVNHHIAIPIEPVGYDASRPTVDPTVKPYHTLLFPNASPTDLLQTFRASGSVAPQRLEQLLNTVDPQKPLTEIAIASNLPLHTTMEMASLLVTQGVCISSPVISSQSRLTCLHIRRIPELALEFSQAFPSVNVFEVVSFLTTSRTLGEIMAVVTDLENDEGAWLREVLLSLPDLVYTTGAIATKISSGNSASLDSPERVEGGRSLSPYGIGLNASATTDPQQHETLRARQWVEEVEKLVYAIAIWLLSHEVVTQLQDYLVVVASPGTAEESSKLNPSVEDPTSSSEEATKCQQQQQQQRPPKLSSASSILRSTPTQTDVDENLFQEAMSMDCLNGNLSTTALAWRLGMELSKLKAWAYRHPQIRLLSRVPSPGDDLEPALP